MYSLLNVDVSEGQGNKEDFKLFFLRCKSQQQSENIIDTLSVTPASVVFSILPGLHDAWGEVRLCSPCSREMNRNLSFRRTSFCRNGMRAKDPIHSRNPARSHQKQANERQRECSDVPGRYR